MKKSYLFYGIVGMILSAFVFFATLITMNAKFANMDAMEKALKFIKVVKGLGIASAIIGTIAMIKKEGISVLGIISVLLSAVSITYIGISAL